MFKYHTTRFGTDAVAAIDKLRLAFPRCHFAAGICKDVRGIYAFADREVREYGEKWELPNGDLFWAASAATLTSIRANLPKYQSAHADRIAVKLVCGETLQIFPASAIPKKVLFTRKAEENPAPFNVTVPYGRLAYALFDRTQKDDKIMLDDKQMMQLVMCALSYSYDLPEPLWDALELVSYGDFDRIFAAAMGMDWEYLQEEVGKSNAASAQATGAIAV